MTAGIKHNYNRHTLSQSGTIAILHIEDSEAENHSICDKLESDSQTKYIVKKLRSLTETKQHLSRNQYDIIFLDLSLPDCSGIDTLTQLRALSHSTPIIVLTDSNEEEIKDQIIQYGAQDFIDKNEPNEKIVTRSIRYSIDRKKIESELKQLAQTDELTKLPNRSLFIDRLKHALIKHKRKNSDDHLVVMLLDLDNFKDVNDTLGHSVGDALLIQVANRLLNCFRESDTIARLGGDEFTILLEEVDQLNTTGVIANKILASLTEPFLIDNKPIFTSASIGVSSTHDQKNSDSEIMLKNADIAMYTAKKRGGNQVGFFTRDLQVSIQIRNNLESNLRTAIDQNQLKVYFQPQIDIQTGKLSGAEALLRWQHPQHGIIPPDGFIPILEETGLIIPATEWVITKSLSVWQQWQNLGVVDKAAHLSINLSPKYFRHHHTHQNIEQICNQFSVNRNQIIFELTENTFIETSPKNLNILNTLSEDGFKLAIDDFGTGYSSLGYLKAFPIDCLKLDRIFINDILKSTKDKAIAEAVIQLCKKLNIELIAEGVDSKEKLSLLKEIECRIIQGFYFSKALPDEDFAHYAQQFSNTQ